MRERESDEIEVKLEFFEVFGSIELWVEGFVLLYYSGDFVEEQRLFIERRLFDGFVEYC